MGLASALAGQAIERRIGELLGFDRQMNVVPNPIDAMIELANYPLVQDMGEKIVDDIGVAHVYRLSYEDTEMHDYAAIIRRGTDYVFTADTKELKMITHWYKDPDDYNEGRSTMLIVRDEIVDVASLQPNPFDLATNGLVALPVIANEPEEETWIQITLPEDGCFTVRKDDLALEMIAENEEEARERGLLNRP